MCAMHQTLPPRRGRVKGLACETSPSPSPSIDSVEFKVRVLVHSARDRQSLYGGAGPLPRVRWVGLSREHWQACVECLVPSLPIRSSVCQCSSILGRCGSVRLNAGVEGIAGADRRDRGRNVWTSCSGLSWGVALGSRHVSYGLVALVSLTLDWLMDAVGIPRGSRELRDQAATPYLSGVPD